MSTSPTIRERGAVNSSDQRPEVVWSSPSWKAGGQHKGGRIVQEGRMKDNKTCSGKSVESNRNTRFSRAFLSNFRKFIDAFPVVVNAHRDTEKVVV